MGVIRHFNLLSSATPLPEMGDRHSASRHFSPSATWSNELQTIISKRHSLAGERTGKKFGRSDDDRTQINSLRHAQKALKRLRGPFPF